MKGNQSDEEFLWEKRERRKQTRAELLARIHAAEERYGGKVPAGSEEMKDIQAFTRNMIPSPFNGEELYKRQNMDTVYVRLIDDIIIKKSRAGYEKKRIAKMLNVSTDWVKDTLKKANDAGSGYFSWLAKREGEEIYSTSLDGLKKYFEYYHHGDLMRESDKGYKWLPEGWQLAKGKYYYWQLPSGAEYIRNGKLKRKD